MAMFSQFALPSCISVSDIVVFFLGKNKNSLLKSVPMNELQCVFTICLWQLSEPTWLENISEKIGEGSHLTKREWEENKGLYIFLINLLYTLSAG